MNLLHDSLNRSGSHESFESRVSVLLGHRNQSGHRVQLCPCSRRLVAVTTTILCERSVALVAIARQFNWDELE